MTEKLCECGCGQPTSRIDKNNAKAGRVKGEWSRFVRGHSTRRTCDYYRVEDRGFETPCWIWQLGASEGYGRLKRGGRMVQAHRYYYEQANSSLPPGHAVEVHHRCEVTLCVNPDHLEAVAHRRHHVSPVTQEIVNEIRGRYAPYKVTRRALAEEYGLSLKQVTRIVQGETWA